MVMRSSPAWASRSSSLPNALTENGQVGSRNTSKMRGPWPQTSGSACHTFFIRFLLLHLVRTRRGPKAVGRWAPQTASLSDLEQRPLKLMCQSSSWTAQVQRGRPLLALDRETADEEKPPGDGTLTELRRMQPLANGAQSRRYEAVLDDLSTSRVGDRYAGTEMVHRKSVHG